MSDSDRSAESEPSSSPDSDDVAEQPSEDAASSASLPVAEAAPESESKLEAEANARVPDASNSGARKRSSIRPARPDWRPSARAVSNPPRPMVVVYSGDSERPDWWKESGQASDPPALDADTPLPPEPALSARELRPPPAARFPEIVPPAPDQSVTGTAKFPSITATSATNSNEPGATEAPVALSASASSGPAVSVPEKPARTLVRAEHVEDSDARRLNSLRRASTRRAAVVIAGAFFGAYIAAQRFSARAPASVSVSISANSAAARESERAAPVPTQPEPAPISARAEPAPTATQAEPAPTATQAQPAPIASAASAEAAAPERSQPGARTVVIEVVPYDAKVLLAGVAQPGPPFVVSVPDGKRVAFEVARKGYAPRRVVVDGSESKLTVGLLHNRGARIEPAPAAPHPAEPDPGEPGRDSRLRVRSGL